MTLRTLSPGARLISPRVKSFLDAKLAPGTSLGRAGGIIVGMSITFRMTALYAGWLLASIAETRELSAAPAGVNLNARSVPHQRHGELPLPEPVLLGSEPQFPPGRASNEAATWEYVRRQEEADGLFTMDVARKNARNHALFHLLNRPAAA